VFRVFLGAIAFTFAITSKALAQSIPTCNIGVIDWLVDFLPSTPTDLKLSNVLTEFAIQAPIGSAVIFEAYSGAFQIMSLVAFFKGIKLLVDIKKLIF
jgi:hypothetical protein